jgi:hypothetical protein
MATSSHCAEADYEDQRLSDGDLLQAAQAAVSQKYVKSLRQGKGQSHLRIYRRLRLALVMFWPLPARIYRANFA